MDRVLAQADDGDQAAGRALEAILAAQRLYAAADAKMAEALRLLGDTSAAFHAIRAAVLPASPDHPTPPPTRGVLVLAACLVGVALSAAHPGDLTVSTETGKAALRRGNHVKAEHMFARAGDELGVAEALINQKRYDEAALICERHATDPRAKLYLGLIARAKGDAKYALELLYEARGMGSLEARDLLAFEEAHRG